MATIIGSYEILHSIASGGMGEVFLARHNPTRREVALKVLYPQYSRDPEFVARFMREAQATVQLRHHHIVEVFDANMVDGSYYIAMENLSGGSLSAYLTQLRKAGQVMSVEEALEITRQIASALDYAHQRGFIHRDIKPSNILRAADGRWVLTDFGIVLSHGATKLTRSVSIMGTAEYMSPEQGQGREVDNRTDIYALGVVMYEMLTGRLPFEAETPVALLYKHVHEPPPVISRIRPGLPSGVAAVVNRAMAKKPEQRFSSATELIMALDGALSPVKKIAPVWIAAGGLLAGLGVVGSIVLLSGGGQPEPITPTAAALARTTVSAPTSAATAVVRVTVVAPTATLLPMDTPSPATATPTSTPSIATATSDEAQITRTPTPRGPTPTRTSTPTPPLAAYAPPGLILPVDNASFGNADRPTFSWSSAGALAADVYYRFVIEHRQGQDVTCTKKTNAVSRDYIASLSNGQAVRWFVDVVRVTGAITDGAACAGATIAGPSASRSVKWDVASSGVSGPPKPTIAPP